MLDALCVPQIGDPFVIPKPRQSYAALLDKPLKPLKIGIVFDEFFDVAVDPEVKQAVLNTAKTLSQMGHHVEIASASFGRDDVWDLMNMIFFYGFDARLDGLGAKMGRKPSLDTLEPGIFMMYEMAKGLKASDFFNGMAGMNAVRRNLSKFWGDYDIWLSPTTAQTAAKWDTYNLETSKLDLEKSRQAGFEIPIQYTFAHNIMGTPAISLPLGLDKNGLPIGVQLAASPSRDHIVLQLARSLEIAMPWGARVPEIWAGRD
jgi:amidase